MIKRILLIWLFLLFPVIALSAPAITSVDDDTIAHDGTLVIYDSGSGFGSKSTAAPVAFDDCESGSPGDTWTFHPDSGSGALGSYGKIGAYRSKADIDGWGSPYGGGVDPPHSKSTNYYCSNAYTTGTGGETQQDESSLGIATGGTTYAYYSFYYRVDPDWTYNGGSDGNHKMMSVSSGSTPYGGTFAYWEFRCNRLDQSADIGIRDLFSSTCLITTCDQVTPMPTHPRTGDWVRIEYFMYFNASGFQKAVVDNTTIFNRTSCEILGTTPDYIGIGGYHRDYGSDNANAGNWRYLDDIYFDTTFSRVILANNATYSSATIIEPQPPTAWATGEITVTVNQGALPNGTAYLFVFDSANDANATGYPVTLEGSSTITGVTITGVSIQ